MLFAFLHFVVNLIAPRMQRLRIVAKSQSL